MKALVTGGGGFIGSALARELAAGGNDVTCFSRGDYPWQKGYGIKAVRGNLSDYDTVLKACENIETVFHVAAKAGIWGSYSDYYSTNVKGTQNIILACKMMNVRHLVYTSSASVVFGGTGIEGMDESLPYPSKYLSLYASTKASAEKIVLNADSPSLKTISLRPHIVLGKGDVHLIPRLILRAKEGKLRCVGEGKNMIDITWIENLVNAHLLASEALDSNPEASGKAFFITNGEPVCLWQFINQILEGCGIETIRKSVPVGVAMTYASALEAIYTIFNLKGEPFLTRSLVGELSSSHWFNISAARKYLGYNPDISNEEGTRKLMESLKSASR